MYHGNEGRLEDELRGARQHVTRLKDEAKRDSKIIKEINSRLRRSEARVRQGEDFARRAFDAEAELDLIRTELQAVEYQRDGAESGFSCLAFPGETPHLRRGMLH